MRSDRDVPMSIPQDHRRHKSFRGDHERGDYDQGRGDCAAIMIVAAAQGQWERGGPTAGESERLQESRTASISADACEHIIYDF
jgi:hypothetical protein